MTVQFSDIGTSSGVILIGNSISADPKFINAASGNFRLSSSPLGFSPCIDTASFLLTGNDIADIDEDGLFAPPLPFDLDMLTRWLDFPAVGTDVADMGAYESHAIPPQ